MLPNNWPTERRTNSLVRRFLRDAVDKYFTKDYGDLGPSAWCDFRYYDGEEVLAGQEPAYFGDELKLVAINRDKGNSFICSGHAFGYYGSGIRSKTKLYQDYRYRAKFVRFVDHWHPILFPDSVSNAESRRAA